MPITITLKELSVQLIISAVGEQSVSGANVGDGVWMYHVYAACYPPFALGRYHLKMLSSIVALTF